MPELLDIPNEMIHQMLLHVLPEDIENFAQICRRVAAVAQPVLTQHRMLIQSYNTFDNTKTPDDGSIDRLAEEFAANPYLLQYLMRLDYKVLDETPKRLQSESSCIQLLGAPNLRTLSIEDRHPIRVNQSRFSQDLRDILEQPPTMLPRPYLTKLKRVHLRGFIPDYAYVDELIRAFSMLPALTSFRVEEGCYFHLSTNETFESGITELSFLKCVIKTRVLAAILRYFSYLETFTHTGPKNPVYNFTFGGDLIAESLIQNKETLREIMIISPSLSMSPFVDLRKFKAIRKLEVSWDLLPVSVRDDIGLCGGLPESLEVLKVHSEADLDGYQYARGIGRATQHQEFHHHPLQGITLFFKDPYHYGRYSLIVNKFVSNTPATRKQSLLERCCYLNIFLVGDRRGN